MLKPIVDRFYTAVTNPIRVIRTLYNFARVLDQNPQLLRSERAPFSNAPTADDDDQTVSVVGSEGQKNCFEIEAPATASQVYHAAILNGTTLDDLLAVFEVSDGPATVRGCLGDSSHQRADFACDTYRNSSIQTTPESAITPRKGSATLGVGTQHEIPSVDQRPYGQLVQTTTAESMVEEKELTHLPRLYCQPEGDDNQTQTCENTCPNHVECPTFARRQARSRLPQRAKYESKQQREATKERVTSLKANESPDSPSKRTRLHRRSRVF
jgi:hypothetical protein